MIIVEQMLKQILNELKEIKENQNKTHQRLDNLESDVKDLKQGQSNLESDVKDLKQGQKEIKNHLTQLDTKNANRHMDAFSKIKNIDKDVKFIKHKLHQTEEDVFDIKDHLKAIK
jgi:chromosome segregation ATPase